MGFWDRAGLDIESIPLANGGAIVSGVVSGAIDIGCGNAITIETAYKKGIPLTVIAPAGLVLTSAPVSLLFVAKTSAIRTAKDLTGKTIGVSPLGGIGQIAVSAWLDKFGGDSSSVKYIELPFPETVVALNQGRVDAASCSEPFASAAKTTARLLADPFAALGDDYLITAFFALKPWALAHADLVARFTAVIRETAIWANAPKNWDRSAEILAKYTQTDAASVKGTVRARFATTLNAAQLQPTIDAAARYKQLDAPFSAEELIFPGR